MGATPSVTSLNGPYLDLVAFAASGLASGTHKHLPSNVAAVRLVFPPFTTIAYLGSRN